MTIRTSRAMPIIRVRATCRVPFGLIPVRAAIATMMTAMTSHESQVMGVMLLSKAVHQQRSKRLRLRWNFTPDWAASHLVPPCGPADAIHWTEPAFISGAKTITR